MRVRHTPTPEGLNADFYAQCASGRLCFQRCDDCGRWRHPPRVLCASCGSWQWSWQASKGRGRIHSWTVTHRPLHPAFADALPYAVVVVEMEEGVRLVSSLLDAGTADLALDQPVEAKIEVVSESMGVPFFRRGWDQKTGDRSQKSES